MTLTDPLYVKLLNILTALILPIAMGSMMKLIGILHAVLQTRPRRLRATQLVHPIP